MQRTSMLVAMLASVVLLTSCGGDTSADHPPPDADRDLSPPDAQHGWRPPDVVLVDLSASLEHPAIRFTDEDEAWHIAFGESEPTR